MRTITNTFKFAAALLLLSAPTIVAAQSAPTVSIGAAEIAMSASQRINSVGTYAPDSAMHAFVHNGTNYVFMANGGSDTTEGITTPDFNNLANNLSLINTTSTIPRGGPGSFDERYAGSGAVYYDNATGILVNLYHGESWYSSNFLPFYSGLGIAYSRDLGKTWNKLGQVLSPQTARQGNCQVEIGGGTLLVVGDYFYTYYTDEGAGCDGGNFETAVARAKISDVMAAVQAGTPLTSGTGTLWKKYYQGNFTENGVNDLANPASGGGAFTHLFTTGNAAWWHTVAYDSAINQYVMAYVAGWNGIAMRFSSDGINWGSATQVVAGGTDFAGGNAVYYPSLFNTSGGDPENLGASFHLYYVDHFGDWTQSTLKRVQITLSGVATRPEPPIITQVIVH